MYFKTNCSHSGTFCGTSIITSIFLLNKDEEMLDESNELEEVEDSSLLDDENGLDQTSGKTNILVYNKKWINFFVILYLSLQQVNSF